MIKINELDELKPILQDLTEKEASNITGGALNSQISNINNLLSGTANPQLASLAAALQNALSKIVAQIAANNK
jgi:hypothetical protein